MKIAIISFYSGHIERGVENWIFQLGNRLQRNHQVVVFQNGPRRINSKYKTEALNIKVNWGIKDSKGTLRRLFFIDYWSLLIALFTVKIIPKIITGKFDVIIPTDGGWQPAFIRILTWIIGIKMVIVGHSGRGWDDRNNIYSFPNVFVGLSAEAKSWAKRINPLIRCEYIPNGIDLKMFKNSGETAKIRLPKPIILLVGSPQLGKRMELAIKAVSRLKNASLLILGKGSGEDKINKLGQVLLGDRFLLKLVPFKDTPKYYRASDIFTLPSWSREAFGMVYLEAMACGLPVVATNDETKREIIGEAGILVDVTNLDEYSHALEKVLLRDWGDKPRKQAERYSWDIVVEKYENLFKSLVKD